MTGSARLDPRRGPAGGIYVQEVLSVVIRTCTRAERRCEGECDTAPKPECGG